MVLLRDMLVRRGRQSTAAAVHMVRRLHEPHAPGRIISSPARRTSCASLKHEAGRGRLHVHHLCGGRVAFKALAAPQEAAVVEHVLRGRIEGPVVALTGVARLAGDLDEAVIEGEVVSDAVLPGGEALTVVGEARHDEITDAA